MPDQANTLRSLALNLPKLERDESDTPPLVVVLGARPRVGVTTVAVNLGAVLADIGLRTVLVEATGNAPALAKAAGVAFFEKKSSQLQETPSGAWLMINQNHDDPPGHSRRHNRQLMADMQRIRPDADVIVVDAGNEDTPTMRRLWRRARVVLAVTTPDDPAIMDCYAKIKLAGDEPDVDIRILVNLCNHTDSAGRAVARIAAACERFLGRTVKAAPSLPANTLHRSQERIAPRAWDSPDNAFAHAALWLGRSVIDALAAQTADNGPRLAAT